jgi:hypothetical protein
MAIEISLLLAGKLTKNARLARFSYLHTPLKIKIAKIAMPKDN